MTDNNSAKFLTGPTWRHVTVMAFTASLGLMAVFFVDFADMVFISMLGREELTAAVGYAGTVLYFTMAFGIGMAIASGALVARLLGMGDRLRAREATTYSVIYGIVFGLLVAGLVWFNLRGILSLLGATGETADHAREYLMIVIPSMPFLMIGILGGAVLRSNGAARAAMMSTIYAGLVNAILDPILIFGFDMELTGAALATVASRVAMAFVALRPIVKTYGGFVRPNWSGTRVYLVPFLAIAGPAMMTQIATPFGQAYVTRMIAQYGEHAVAGMAIVGRLMPLAFGTIFALSGAVGPIIGQNFGAQKQDRVASAFRDALIFTAGIVAAASLILFVMRGPLAALFSAEGQTRDLLYLFCGPLALLFFFNGAIFVGNAAFNNLRKPLYSTAINWGRNTIGTIPFAIIGAQWGGAEGVMIGQAVGGVVFGLLAIWLGWRVIHAPQSAPSNHRS